MESRRPPEFGLELSADRSNIKDVIKGDYTYTSHYHDPPLLTAEKGYYILFSSIAIFRLYNLPLMTYWT